MLDILKFLICLLLNNFLYFARKYMALEILSKLLLFQ